VEPRPVEPPPKKNDPVKKAAPVKTAPPKAAAKAEPKAEPKAETKQYALKRVSPSSSSKTSTTSKSTQPSLKDDINKSIERIGKTRMPVVIRTPGAADGPGGDQYALLVRETYDRAWVDPSELADSGAEVEVEVTIARNGEIVSAKVVSRSGIGALDASVQKALDRVKRIPQPMPPSMTERQKTYVISFNLRDRR
jgi:TolA protein